MLFQVSRRSAVQPFDGSSKDGGPHQVKALIVLRWNVSEGSVGHPVGHLVLTGRSGVQEQGNCCEVAQTPQRMALMFEPGSERLAFFLA
jgi:hypothetical protein